MKIIEKTNALKLAITEVRSSIQQTVDYLEDQRKQLKALEEMLRELGEKGK